jgi:hypothetical protein
MTKGGTAVLRDVARDAADLFTWWRGELRDLRQWLLGMLPSRRSPELLVRVGSEAATLERLEGGEWKTIGTVPVGADGAWPAELPGLPAELRGARTALVFPAADFYFDEIELPLAAESHLQAVLRLQLERRLPMALDALLTGHVVVARDKRRERLRVRVAVAHRERIEKLRASAVGWGVAPVRAGIDGDDGTMQFDLLRRRRDPMRWTPSALDRRMLMVAGAAAAALLMLVGMQWWRERAVVDEQTAELRAHALKLEMQRVALTARASPLVALRAVAAVPAAPEVLAKLSGGVPSTAWFTRVDLALPLEGPGTIKLMGSATTQDEITTALRAIPGVSNVRATSAYSGELMGRERVEITADFAAPLATAAAQGGAL